MKKTPRLLVLFLLAAPFAFAAPGAAPKRAEHWVEPAAQKVIDRATAAYDAVEGWTSTMITELRSMRDNVEEVGTIRSIERYLRVDGSVPCVAWQNTYKDELVQMVSQDAEGYYDVDKGKDAFAGRLAPALPEVRPYIFGYFRTFVKGATYVRYWGQESVGGVTCDVVELTTATPGEEEGVAPSVAMMRVSIDATGFIHRLVDSRSRMDGSLAYSGDLRITFDPHAKLTAAEFSRASFERAVTAATKAPMPELVSAKDQLFQSGGTLPAVSFTGWADQKAFRLADLPGKVVVVETWASWCHFCKQAFPFYEKMRQKLVDQGVVFVAVSFDQKMADYEKWMKAHGAEYGFKFGHIDSEDPAKALGDFKGSLPAFYVLGRDGKIVSSYSGFGYEPDQDDPRLLAALREAGVKI